MTRIFAVSLTASAWRGSSAALAQSSSTRHHARTNRREPELSGAMRIV